VCNKIFNSLAVGEQYFDKDFGPKDADDTEGSKKSIYFDGNPSAMG
jgi:hypothetical protein